MGKGIAVKIEVGQGLRESDLITHAGQFEATPQVMRRHIAFLDLLPHGSSAITVHINYPAEMFLPGRRKHHQTLFPAFNYSVGYRGWLRNGWGFHFCFQLE